MGGNSTGETGRCDVRLPRAADQAYRRTRRVSLSRTRKNPRRRQRRDRPRNRGRGVCLRHSSVIEGRIFRSSRRRRRYVQHAPAGRRRSRHHPVQFSGHGAAVDVSDRARLRKRLRPEAVGARSNGHLPNRPTATGGRTAAGRLQHRQRRQGSGRHASRQQGDRRHQLRRLDRYRRIHLRPGLSSGEARTSAMRGKKITSWSCPMPT